MHPEKNSVFVPRPMEKIYRDLESLSLHDIISLKTSITRHFMQMRINNITDCTWDAACNEYVFIFSILDDVINTHEKILYL